MDMITDMGVIKTYQASGNTSGANSLIAMIGSSLAAQLLFTYTQNRKKSKWVILRELAFVVSFLKPAVDAFRVATGFEDMESTVNPLLDMAIGKGTELAFESIPGGLLQAYMFINSPEKTMFLLISILISTLTTGYASAMISYDMDVSVTTRKEVPLFYGYIKDSNTERGITFVLLILLASLHNFSRTIGTALLLSVSKELTFGIILAELALYHIYKIVRRDYVVWIVGLEGGLKWVSAFLCHSIFKILVDYTGERVIPGREKRFHHILTTFLRTGMVHLRGPKVCGGALFSFQTIVSQCYPFVSLYFYRRSSIKDKTDPNMLKTAFTFLAITC